MTRTFSKIYGLAAARVGWAYAPAHVAQALNHIRSPFNVAGPSMAAAVAALGDRAHIEAAKAHNAVWRDQVTHELREMGYDVAESCWEFRADPVRQGTGTHGSRRGFARSTRGGSSCASLEPISCPTHLG